MEQVDLLIPPAFRPSGIVLPVSEAIRQGAWLGTFNLWVIQRRQEGAAIIYQQRSLTSPWEPGKLDVAAGGHYLAGEQGIDGLREAREELGVEFDLARVIPVGRRLNVSRDTNNRDRNTVVSVFLAVDSRPLEGYRPDPAEVEALYACDLTQLQRLYQEGNYNFTCHGILGSMRRSDYNVTRDSFPINWDNYHRKMVHLISDYLQDGHLPEL